MSTTSLRLQLNHIDTLIAEGKTDEAIDKIAKLIEALMKLREHLWHETHISGTVYRPTADVPDARMTKEAKVRAGNFD